MKSYIGELKKTVRDVAAANDSAFGTTPVRLAEAVASLERATDWLLANPRSDAALGGATPYLRLFAHTAGGAMLAREALAATRRAAEAGAPARLAIARFFAENIAVAAEGLERAVTAGSDSIGGADAALD